MTCNRIILRPIRGRILTLKQLRQRDRRITPASRAATINRASQIVAKVLENTRREFGGVGWPGHSVVDIVLVGEGRRQLIASQKKTFVKTDERVNNASPRKEDPFTYPFPSLSYCRI
jgi:hypothetical protein